MIKFKINIPLLLLIFTFGYTQLYISCNNDDDEVIRNAPTIANVEIGSGNNMTGMIGRDFHFEMDVVAGELIETVRILVQQRDDQNYVQEWSHEINWDEYQGLKNANVHKHFNVPKDAVEGLYDFVIIIEDQNGASLEEVREIELIDPEDLPVDPTIRLFSISQKDGQSDFQTFYSMDTGFAKPTNKTLAKGDFIDGWTSIGQVKNDGMLYFLLIKKSLNHKPETVDAIDFSKAIVYDVIEHKYIEERTNLANFLLLTEWGERDRPEFIIGDSEDNNLPSSGLINGDKTWENGMYYLGVVYTNTTHELSVHYYLEVEIVGF